MGPSGAHLPASDRRRLGLGALPVSKQAAKHKSLLDYRDLGKAFRSLAATAGQGWRDLGSGEGGKGWPLTVRLGRPLPVSTEGRSPWFVEAGETVPPQGTGRRRVCLKTQPGGRGRGRLRWGYFRLQIKGIQECT